MSDKRLGRGLEALIRPREEMPPATRQGAATIPIKDIKPNPHQPRQQFDEVALEELAASIREKGVLTPITVRIEDDQYILVAGERRLRAALMAGLRDIPAYIVEVSDEAEMMEMSLIENIQRENLNPIEEAEAYAFLNSKFDLPHEKIAQAVGKKRVTVANALRLLTLPMEIRNSIREGSISAGHGRAILMMKTTAAKYKLWKQIVQNGMSVRAAEAYAKSKASPKPAPKKKSAEKVVDQQVKALEDELISILGTKVKIFPQQKGGRIEVSYFSEDDLERIIDLLRSIS
ncbi:MAG: ParB/RepB/Spo0J family partition protein [FCB group bacterium]|nr:ParB/RepB/Spo0J family partition protein [FCB group bacterium]